MNRENCHPFRFGRLVFQHNGHIEEFKKIKRKMLSLITDEAFHNISGGTDSEHFFALILSNLPDPSRTSLFQLSDLEKAVNTAMSQVLDLLKQAGVTGGFTTLNMTLTDGHSMVVTRFCDKFPAVPPPSLYFCYEPLSVLGPLLSAASKSEGPGDGSNLKDGAETNAQSQGLPHTERDYDVTHERWLKDDAALAEASKDPSWRALIVSSECLTSSSEAQWFPLPAQSILTYERATERTDHRSRPKLSPVYCEQVPIVLPDCVSDCKRQRMD